MRFIQQRIIRRLARDGFSVHRSLRTAKGLPGDQRIFLTFDDGPDPKHTPELLEFLSHHRIPATFFLCGGALEQNLDLGKRIADHGHTLGNHTFSHPVIAGLPKDQLREEIERCQTLIHAIDPTMPSCFRPPRGLIGFRELRLLSKWSFQTYLWDSNSVDTSNSDVPEKVDRLRTLSTGNHIVLFHDDSATCLRMLQDLVPAWKERGFDFGAIGRPPEPAS